MDAVRRRRPQAGGYRVKVHALFKKGLKIKAIAKELDITYGAAHYHVRQIKARLAKKNFVYYPDTRTRRIKRPRIKRKTKPTRRETPYKPASITTFTPFSEGMKMEISEERRKEVTALRKAKHSFGVIAKLMGMQIGDVREVLGYPRNDHLHDRYPDVE